MEKCLLERLLGFEHHKSSKAREIPCFPSMFVRGTWYVPVKRRRKAKWSVCRLVKHADSPHMRAPKRLSVETSAVHG